MILKVGDRIRGANDNDCYTATVIKVFKNTAEVLRDDLVEGMGENNLWVINKIDDGTWGSDRKGGKATLISCKLDILKKKLIGEEK